MTCYKLCTVVSRFMQIMKHLNNSGTCGERNNVLFVQCLRLFCSVRYGLLWGGPVSFVERSELFFNRKSTLHLS